MFFAVHTDDINPILQDAKMRAYVMFLQQKAEPTEALELAQFHYCTIMRNERDRRSQVAVPPCRHKLS